VDPAGWTELPLREDLEAQLSRIPAVPGVGVLRGPDGRALLAGAPSSLRRWAASHLGLGRPPRPGKRPKTNLRGIAQSLSLVPTSSPFAQRLTFERTMSREFPGAPRRDLKPPYAIQLDLAPRFPRIRVVRWTRGARGMHGPFRDRRAAERASSALQGLFPLRPCDHLFEPDRELPLGLGCLFAQVASCSAPCLARMPEAEYRGLAASAHALLADPDQRLEPIPEIPSWVAAADGGRALLGEAIRDRIEVHPVSSMAVLDESAAASGPRELASAIASLRWEPPDPPRDDSAWLMAWLHSRRRTGACVALGSLGAEPGAERLAAALGLSAA
jgi:excinuclease ABC subunit C